MWTYLIKEHIWVVRVIETKSRKNKLEFMKDRNDDNLKKYVQIF